MIQDIGPSWIACPALEATPPKKEKVDDGYSKRFLKWWFSYPLHPQAADLLPTLAEHASQLETRLSVIVDWTDSNPAPLFDQVAFPRRPPTARINHDAVARLAIQINQFAIQFLSIFPTKPLTSAHCEAAWQLKKLTIALKKNYLGRDDLWLMLSRTTLYLINETTPAALPPTGHCDLGISYVLNEAPYHNIYTDGLFKDSLRYQVKCLEITAKEAIFEVKDSNLLLTKKLPILEQKSFATSIPLTHLKEFCSFEATKGNLNGIELDISMREKEAVIEYYVHSVLASIGVPIDRPLYLAENGEYALTQKKEKTVPLVRFLENSGEEMQKQLAVQFLHLLSLEAMYGMKVFDYRAISVRNSSLVTSGIHSIELLDNAQLLERKQEFLSYLSRLNRSAPSFLKIVISNYPEPISELPSSTTFKLCEMHRLTQPYGTGPVQSNPIQKINELIAARLSINPRQFNEAKACTDSLINCDRQLETALIEYFAFDYLNNDLPLIQYLDQKWLNANGFLSHIKSQADALPRVDQKTSNSSLFELYFWQHFHNHVLSKILKITKTPLASELLILRSTKETDKVHEALHRHLMAYAKKRAAKALLSIISG